MAKLIDVNPLILPNNYIEKRTPEINERSRGGPLEEFDLLQFDNSTIFYDVFFNYDGSKLVAIGPPFLNLSRYMRSIQLTINGEVAKFHMQTLPRNLVCLVATLKSKVKEVNTVMISFDHYDWSEEIRFSKNSKKISLALTTLQRDNRIHWILDWVKYYEKALQVEQFLIYDNQSEYQSQLIDLLPDNVLVVPWNSPFGPTASPPNNFLQIGSLNHSRLRFAEVDTFLNFDIDELLIVKNEKVKTYINKFSTVRFSGYVVPNVPTDNNFSYSDFTEREPEAQIDHKYSFKRTKVSYNRVHKAAPINKIAAKVFPSLFIKEVPTSQAYFLHYSAINTDWKAKTSRLGRKNRLALCLHPDHLISDYSVKRVLDQF